MEHDNASQLTGLQFPRAQFPQLQRCTHRSRIGDCLMSIRIDLTTGLPIRGSSASGRTGINRERILQLLIHLEMVELKQIESTICFAGTLPLFRNLGFHTVEDIVTHEKTVVY